MNKTDLAVQHGPTPVDADDYEHVVDRAVVASRRDDAEERERIYGRSRSALQNALGRPEIAASEMDIAREMRALDTAIDRVEARYGAGTGLSAESFATGEVVSSTGDRLPADIESRDSSRGRRQFAFNAAASAAVGLFKTGLQIAMLPLMARLLGPTAYGIYALAFPTVLFFVMLADGGLGMSLSREDEDNHIVWSTAFWLLLGTCSVMALGVVGSGFVLARLFDQPSLVPIMGLLALAPLLLAVMLPADARLLRRGNLLWHSTSDFFASIVGASVALTLAFRGAGAWSLAAQYIAAFTVRAVILNAAAWSPPAFEFQFSSLRDHVSTGGALLVGRLGELGSKFAENAVFGHVFGTTSLGAYTLANQVSKFTNDAVANPVIGAFYAQSLRETDAQVAALHARLARTVLMVLLPATAIMAVVAPDVFPIILGPQWHDAAPIFQAVVVPYALSVTAWLSGQVLLRHGMTGRSARVVLGCGAVRVGVVALGLWLPPVAVVWLVGATYVIQAAWMTLAVPQGLAAGPRTLLAGIWVPALAAAGAAVATATVIARVPDDLFWATAGAGVGGLIYLVLLVLLGGNALRNDIVDLKAVLRRRSA